jgi:hypothetical protein
MKEMASPWRENLVREHSHNMPEGNLHRGVVKTPVCDSGRDYDHYVGLKDIAEDRCFFSQLLPEGHYERMTAYGRFQLYVDSTTTPSISP